MFYNVVADLPTFAENSTNKENIIKELMQENGVVNAQEGIGTAAPSGPSGGALVVDGEEKKVKKAKKKGCGC